MQVIMNLTIRYGKSVVCGIFFYVASDWNAIKHRCVTHLYGSNALERVAICRALVKASSPKH